MADRVVKGQKAFAAGSSASVVEQFLIRYRIIFLLLVGLLIAAAVTLGVTTVVSNNAHKKGLAEIDAVLFKLSGAAIDPRANTNDIAYAGEASTVIIDNQVLPAAMDTALEALEPYVQKRNIVGIRANMLKAEILFKQEKWADARDAWLVAAQIKPSVYTAAVSWFRAAQCSERLDDLSDAASYYEKTLAVDDFFLKTHVLFNIGRLKEGTGDYAGAAEQYQKLVDNYQVDAFQLSPYQPDGGQDQWVNLAMSRLIALRIEGLIQ